ncbi:hypothetical protein WN48_11166 [Eufriesea mexicana]|uniref:MADF domain-containing protein n=1 Tax=Eufriesea mexicana TaxID=516756 RepID=A0A310SH71_9HYME|nr:hypothetical protein WN48_11166 [Eufriesea mexicana]
MSCKWNERLVMNFLKSYKQHPCLWNPYHRDYYNCYEKNRALQKIIKDLDIPGFTVNDYIHQIKSIKEKYKLEQMQMIKSLQCQKQYKAPSSWYKIMREMLTKVIDDEEKTQQREATAVFRSISSDNINNSQRKEKMGATAKFLKFRPCNETTCDQFSRRSKSVEKSCHLDEKLRSTEKVIIKEKSEKKVRYVPCPQFKKKEVNLRDQIEDALLSYKPTKDTKSKITEYSEAIPSTSMDSRFNSSFPLTTRNVENYESSFLKCPLYLPYQCLGITDLSEYAKRYIDNSGDFEILQDLSKVPEKIQYADVEIQYSEDLKKVVKDNIPAPTSIQMQFVQLDPIRENKVQCSTIGTSTQKIILSDLHKHLGSNTFVTECISRSTKSIQCARLKLSAKETQSSSNYIVPEKKKNEIGVNTANYIEKQIQNTVCISDDTKVCISLQTLNELGQKKEEKEVAVNIVDYVSKEIQSTICVSRGNLAYCMSSEKMIEFGTTMSLHQVRSIGCITAANAKEFKSNFVQCRFQEKSLTPSKSYNSIKHCVQDKDFKHFVEKKTQEFEDVCTINTCPLNILHLSKEDPNMMSVLQELLQNILSIHENRTQDKYKYHLKGNCSIDATKMVTAIKEYTMEMLEPGITKNDTKKFHKKSEIKSSLQEITEKSSFSEINSLTIYENKLIMTEESITEPVFQSTIITKDKSQSTIGDDTLLLENAKRSMIDKEVYTHLNYKDVGINKSLMQLPKHDMMIQSNSQLLEDPTYFAKYEKGIRKKINVGTQKRDPILVRVIKCNESQAVVRSDKETLTIRRDVNLKKKCIDKRIETCGRPTCIPPIICRKSNEFNMGTIFHKERENKVIDNYHVYKNDICDKHCKKKTSYDWTDVANFNVLSNVTNPNIPMYVRPRNYMYCRKK